jgi:hypothetical protein
VRAWVLVIILLNQIHLCGAQTNAPGMLLGSIKVKVLDADNDQPIPYANVYISHSTIGGYTDDKGEVEIKRIPFGTHELVISSLDHQPYQRRLVVKSEQVTYTTVKLLLRVMKEIEVKAKRDDKWNRHYKKFQRLFFGGGHFKDCAINNAYVLDFKSTLSGDFIVTANQPLKIDNRYLGYNIDFELKTCVFSSTLFNISGNVRFEEKEGDDSLKRVWKEHREETYLGSPQHFFRSVVDTTVDAEGYNVYADIFEGPDIVRGATFRQNVNRSIAVVSISNKVSPGHDVT